MQINRRILAMLVGVTTLASILFLINIQFPSRLVFEEQSNVPAAKELIQLNRYQNRKDPPLGKYLLGIGILLDRDRSFGWRWISALFGVLTLVGVFFFALYLFRNESIALFTTMITGFNQLLYVQSRIAMPDIFMFCFLIWGLAFFVYAWESDLPRRRVRKAFLVCGVFMGLAIATRWWAMIPWMTCIGLVLLVRLFQYWELRFGKEFKQSAQGDDTWYSPELWITFPTPTLLTVLVGLPVLIYFLSFLPLLFLHGDVFLFGDLFTIQFEMLQAHLEAGLKSSHPYASSPLQWPFLNRPIWYAFEKEGNAGEWVRGVFLLGNPLIMWSGIGALIVCLWIWMKEHSRQAFLILAFFFSSYLCWWLIPAPVMFYSDYFSAGMFLSFAIAFVFHRFEKGFRNDWPRWSFVVLSFGIFVYFFPILAALKIPTHQFRDWMWLHSWI